MDERDAYGLMPIDYHIIRELMRGQCYDDIARDRCWGLKTLRMRCKLIYWKLGVSNRQELLQWAWEHL